MQCRGGHLELAGNQRQQLNHMRVCRRATRRHQRFVPPRCLPRRSACTRARSGARARADGGVSVLSFCPLHCSLHGRRSQSLRQRCGALQPMSGRVFVGLLRCWCYTRPRGGSEHRRACGPVPGTGQPNVRQIARCGPPQAAGTEHRVTGRRQRHPRRRKPRTRRHEGRGVGIQPAGHGWCRPHPVFVALHIAAAVVAKQRRAQAWGHS